ncbi:MAG TPA: hypothetical protein VMT42_02040, partial [candidate division Zixibacteria bacterium]|nr:hypothetical protein [candidate division Zixibacteria bacterium]
MVALREHEHQTLLTVGKIIGEASVERLMKESGLSDAAVMRAAITLQEKGLVRIHERKETVLKLNAEGKLHARKGLPERRLMNALENLGGKTSRRSAFERADLEKQFIPIALGWAQKKKWTTLDSKADVLQ